MLLWHMHQPFYKDLAEGVYTMPWVRLHALKDYFGMVAMLEEFPSVHMTFNMVPSLVAQLEEYAADTARETAYEVAYKPIESLSAPEIHTLLDTAFQVNPNLLHRFPRFRELEEKLRGANPPSAAVRAFSVNDLADLQVLSQLAWFDEIYLAEDREVRALVGKERGYDRKDKEIVRKKSIEIFNKTLEVYRKAQDRGQIEISTSPFYHPILPLLCDSTIASESHPGVKLPAHLFRHPEDARTQLREAINLHRRVFGREPQGLWPSEGSVSDEVLKLAAEEGFKWAATDEGVLGRSRSIGFYRHGDGTLANGNELYRPHRFTQDGKSIDLFFRDHQLSDLVGFVYSRMDPQAAAGDLQHRIKAAARSMGDRPAVVSVILDGENCWEFYRGNGREFLKSFYSNVAADGGLRAVTASEALSITEPGILNHVVPGSWINANYDVWIGAEEDNHAWDLLGAARDFFAENFGKGHVDAKGAELAREELWIAEGSDWCWWYGPEHSTANDEQFDLLYRKHLSNIYRMLGGSPPDDLAVPIKRVRVRALNVPPTGRVEAQVDGLVSNYFEWVGAGVYTPDYRSGSMHGIARQHIDALYYGYTETALYLRLDFNQAFLETHRDFEIRLNADGETRFRLQAGIVGGKLGAVTAWRGEESLASALGAGTPAQVAFARIFEVRLDLSLLSISNEDTARLQLALWMNELPLQVIPQEGWLELEMTRELLSW